MTSSLLDCFSGLSFIERIPCFHLSFIQPMGKTPVSVFGVSLVAPLPAFITAMGEIGPGRGEQIARVRCKHCATVWKRLSGQDNAYCTFYTIRFQSARKPSVGQDALNKAKKVWIRYCSLHHSHQALDKLTPGKKQSFQIGGIISVYCNYHAIQFLKPEKPDNPPSGESSGFPQRSGLLR